MPGSAPASEASLIVTDEGGLTSSPDTVLISSLNAAPTANAGLDQGNELTVALDTLNP
jgi:hypothetical protein